MKNKKLSLNKDQILKHLRRDLIKVQRYGVFTLIIISLSLYGFMVYQIGQATQKEPSDAQVLEELGVVKRLKIDESSIDKITQLEDQNVEIKALFQEARDNPFKE